MKRARIVSESEGKKIKGRTSFGCTQDKFCFLLFTFCFLPFLAGCGNKLLDPTQIGRFRPAPAVNVILDSLGVAEEAPSAWVGAEEPRPIDTMVYETDYVFSPGDVVRISIFELLQEEVQFANDYVVTETGRISIPEVGVIEAEGLTESQLEEQIKEVLSPTVLKEPLVTVTLMRSQRHVFSILGLGVPTPGRYIIPRYDFRLTDALATAGGIGQFNISYVYVSRSVTGKEVITEPVAPELAEPKELVEPKQEMMEIIAPLAGQGLPLPSRGLVMASAEMVTDKELAEAALPEGFEDVPPCGGQPLDDVQPGAVKLVKRLNGEMMKSSAVKPSTNIKWVFKNDKWVQSETDGPKPTMPAVKVEAEKAVEPAGQETVKPSTVKPSGRIEWIFQDGKWVPVQIGQPKPVPPIEWEAEKPAEPLKEKVPTGFKWSEIGAGGVQTRVIRIPVDKLLGGDPRYNIVIKPGDTINVPVDIIGEFYIIGNTNYQGYINLTGRPMTLKMAIAAAGGLGPLAWPKRCEVTRRISKKEEETVMVDLDKIASGEQPDFFIKPNDLINVGTHPTARWRAVLRNAFRATYGFGFVYDRNFAYDNL